jgi:hypothetical protein
MLNGQSYHSIFSLQSQDAHRALRAGIAQKYALSSLLSLEPLVDSVTRNFMSTLRERSPNTSDKEGTKVDLGEWLQFYAFDVIGAITFSRTFGFIDAGTDERSVLKGLEGGLRYGAVVGQINGLHGWLLGNPFLQNMLSRIPAVAKNDPVPMVFKVSSWFFHLKVEQEMLMWKVDD